MKNVNSHCYIILILLGLSLLSNCTEYVKNKYEIVACDIDLFDVNLSEECIELKNFDAQSIVGVSCLRLILTKKFVVDETTSVRTLFPGGIQRGQDGSNFSIKGFLHKMPLFLKSSEYTTIDSISKKFV
jgi:hypothetical protein